MTREIGNCVYFIGSQVYDGKIKIGKSKDVNKRLAALKTANNSVLIVHKQYIVQDMDRAEKYAHKKAEKNRIRGEWFNLTMDEIDKLYAKLLIKYPPQKNICEIIEKIDVNKYDSLESIKDWFIQNNIRIHESNKDSSELMFLLVDIAKVIDDKHYDRFKSKHLKKIVSKDNMGRERDYLVLTEKGLYEYLILSKRPAAEPFREFVYRLLTETRKKIISDKKLNNLVIGKVLPPNVIDNDYVYESLPNVGDIVERCNELDIDLSILKKVPVKLLYKKLWVNMKISDLDKILSDCVTLNENLGLNRK